MCMHFVAHEIEQKEWAERVKKHQKSSTLFHQNIIHFSCKICYSACTCTHHILKDFMVFALYLSLSLARSLERLTLLSAHRMRAIHLQFILFSSSNFPLNEFLWQIPFERISQGFYNLTSALVYVRFQVGDFFFLCYCCGRDELSNQFKLSKAGAPLAFAFQIYSKTDKEINSAFVVVGEMEWFLDLQTDFKVLFDWLTDWMYPLTLHKLPTV